jgi:glycerol-3-phosphate cytidylyltransferase
MEIGYTTGVFDLFHYGHVNLLRRAKGLCDKLIVGVTADELVKYKGKTSFLPFEDRISVVEACKFVDVAIPQFDINKIEAARKLKANYLFVGDDWYGDKNWEKMESDLEIIGCKVIYLPYTSTISSTKINNALNELRK